MFLYDSIEKNIEKKNGKTLQESKGCFILHIYWINKLLNPLRQSYIKKYFLFQPYNFVCDNGINSLHFFHAHENQPTYS